MEEGANLAKRRKIEPNAGMVIPHWCQELKNYLEQIDQTSIMEIPERLFVLADIELALCPQTGSVLPPNVKHSPQATKKDYLSLIVTLNAEGQLGTPLIVVPKESSLVDVPPDWSLATTKSGKLNANVLEDYIVHKFNEWVIDYSIDVPVLLLVEDHLAHLISPQCKAICKNLFIIIYTLPPNYNHLQPADMSVFAAIKYNWHNATAEFLSNSGSMGTAITEHNIIPFFQSIIGEPDVAFDIENGFAISGLYPFNLGSRSCLQTPD